MLRRLELVWRLDVDFVKPLAGAGSQAASDWIACIVGTRLMRPRNLAFFVCDHDDFADGFHGALLSLKGCDLEIILKVIVVTGIGLNIDIPIHQSRADIVRDFNGLLARALR